MMHRGVNMFGQVTCFLMRGSRAALTVDGVRYEIFSVRFAPQEVTDAFVFKKPYNLKRNCEKLQATLDALIYRLDYAYVYLFYLMLHKSFGVCNNPWSNVCALTFFTFISLVCTIKIDLFIHNSIFDKTIFHYILNFILLDVHTRV